MAGVLSSTSSCIFFSNHPSISAIQLPRDFLSFVRHFELFTGLMIKIQFRFSSDILKICRTCPMWPVNFRKPGITLSESYFCVPFIQKRFQSEHMRWFFSWTANVGDPFTLRTCNRISWSGSSDHIFQHLKIKVQRSFVYSPWNWFHCFPLISKAWMMNLVVYRNKSKPLILTYSDLFLLCSKLWRFRL